MTPTRAALTTTAVATLLLCGLLAPTTAHALKCKPPGPAVHLRPDVKLPPRPTILVSGSEIGPALEAGGILALEIRPPEGVKGEAVLVPLKILERGEQWAYLVRPPELISVGQRVRVMLRPDGDSPPRPLIPDSEQLYEIGAQPDEEAPVWTGKPRVGKRDVEDWHNLVPLTLPLREKEPSAGLWVRVQALRKGHGSTTYLLAARPETFIGHRKCRWHGQLPPQGTYKLIVEAIDAGGNRVRAPGKTRLVIAPEDAPAKRVK